jgi:hypothetical protein
MTARDNVAKALSVLYPLRRSQSELQVAVDELMRALEGMPQPQPLAMVCPEHGKALEVRSVLRQVPIAVCPRHGCSFETWMLKSLTNRNTGK